MLRLSRNKDQEPGAVATKPRSKAGVIAGRIAVVSFMFFLVKGLAWLAVGGLAVAGVLSAG